MFSLLNAGQGATVCLISTIFAKLYMTFFWRFKIVLSGRTKKSMREITESSAYKIAHNYQLNEAEWSPLFVASLLFAHSQVMDVRLASTLAAVGSVWYFWGGIIFGFPVHSFGAALRYVALGLLAREFYIELM